MILVGDIGATHSRLAGFAVESTHLKPVVEETFPSRAYASLDEIVRAFVAGHEVYFAHACFGISGLVGQCCG